MAKITIFRIDISNGINQPALKTFHCNKTIPEGRIRSYRSRITRIYTRKFNRHITVQFRIKPEYSSYNEADERNKDALTGQELTINTSDNG
jgi:hypothetical protein